MVEVGREVAGQVVGHAIEILERVNQRWRLFLHRLDAHDCAGRPGDILREPTPILNRRSNWRDSWPRRANDDWCDVTLDVTRYDPKTRFKRLQSWRSCSKSPVKSFNRPCVRSASISLSR